MNSELITRPTKRARFIKLALGSGAGLVLGLVLIFWLTGNISPNSSQILVINGPVTASFSDSPNQSLNLTRTSEGGQVTVKVTWQGPGAGLVFTVAMDTHSVNLDNYDLGQMAVLLIPSGQEIQAVSWEAPKGGHHRLGTLRFPATTNGSQPVLTQDTRSFQLIIKGVGGLPERVLSWNF